METFLRELLNEGRIVLGALPHDGDERGSDRVLRQAYEVYALSLAGPRLVLDEAVAMAAARMLRRAAWYFLHPGEPIETPDRTLALPHAPRTPEQHVSADLVLRLLPGLYRRAAAHLPGDVLPAALEQVLRQWPLSGVLADLAQPPTTSLDFGGHPGIQLLYAERLARHPRPAWFPEGQGMQYVELVWQQLGRDTSVLPTLAAAVERSLAIPIGANDE